MATPFRLKRSAVSGKRPSLSDLQLGEIALNTYDGYLFAERDTGGVGIGTTVALLTPWTENFGAQSIYYGNSVGIGTTNPTSKLSVVGNALVAGVLTATTLLDGNLNALGKTYYVATNGSDAYAGTSINRPFATIKYALSLAVSGDTIFVQSGTFTEIFPLTVPAGVTVRGVGLRGTFIQPTAGTKQNDGFLLNGDTTVEDLTIGNFFEPGYAFKFAPGKKSTSRSPYVQRVTVLNKGSVTSVTDPYGFDTAHSPPTSYKAGRGVLIDGSVVDATTLEPAMLFNECTFICPNNIALEMTNGARTEWVNCFTYFADKGIYAYDGNVGLASTGYVRIKTSGFIGTTPAANDQIYYLESNSQSGTYSQVGTALTITKVGHGLTVGDRIFADFTSGSAVDGYYSVTGYVGVNTFSVTMAGSATTSGNVSYKEALGFGTVRNYTSSSGLTSITGKGEGLFELPSSRLGKTVTAFGDAQLSTSQEKFGTASLLLDGTGDYARCEGGTDFAFAGNFTAEAWIYPTSVTGNRYLFSLGTETTGRYNLALVSGVLTGNFYGSTSTTFGGSISTGSWTHIALVRSGSTITVYVDGTALGTTETNSSEIGNSGQLTIGADTSGANNFAGYIDEVRISNTARYTGTFTPATSQFNSDGNDKLLLHFDGVTGSTSFTDSSIPVQDIRWVRSGVGIATATRITLADYQQFGAEMRSIGSAVVFGNTGVTADGPGVGLRLFAFNFGHIGSGKDFSQDISLVNQADEVITTNNAKVYFVSIDQSGDFRVGDAFYVNQEAGTVNFGGENFTLNSLSDLNISDGSNTTTITPTYITVGNLQFSGNEITSTSGDITINPSGNSETNISGNLNVSGILTASVLQTSALQVGDTSIALDDTGSNGTIRFNTDNAEALRINNLQNIGIGTTNPTSKLHVVGDTLIAGTLSPTQLNVSGVSTLGVTTFTETVSFGTSAYFGDNDRLNFGDSNDLQIWHNGTNSLISDTGTGDLYIGGNNNVVIASAAFSEDKARFITNGAVELYYDNVKEFETTGYGATVFGILETQGLNVSGVSTTQTLNVGTGGTVITTTSDGLVGINSTVPTQKLDIVGITRVQSDTLTQLETLLTGSTVKIQNTSSTDTIAPSVTLQQARNLSNFSFGDSLGSINYSDQSSTIKSRIGFIKDTSGSAITLSANYAAGGANALRNGIIIRESGNTGIGTTNPISKLHVIGDVIISGITTISDIVLASSTNSSKISTRNNRDLTIESTGGTVFLDSNTYTTGIATIASDLYIGSQRLFENTTNLFVRSPGNIFLQNTDGSNYAGFISGAETRLYYANSKQFETTGAGATVFGLLDTQTLNVSGVATFQDNVNFGDNDSLYFGNGNDLRIYSDGDNSFIKELSSTGSLYIDATNLVIRDQSGAETGAIFAPNGSVSLYYDNVKEFETTGYGATVFGTLETQGLNVTGVGTFLSSGLKIRNPANTAEYSITGGAITANRTLNLPVITGTDTVAVLGLTQTFSGTNSFSGTLSATGTISFGGGAANNHIFGSNQTSGTLTFGGTSGTGLITLGRSTDSQWTDIQANATSSGNIKTIRIGTGGLSGSSTRIDIGPTAGVGTVAINSGTNLGIGSTTPTSKLDVVGDAKFTGVVTATTFIGSFSGISSLTQLSVSGVSTFTGLIDANGGAEIDNIRIGVANDNTIDTSTGNLTLDSNGGQVIVNDQLTVNGSVYLRDNDTLNFGTQPDLYIYHNGSNSFIQEVGTGNLYLTSEGSEITLAKGNVDEYMARFITDGAVELYHNNSKKFETSGIGVTVTGITSTSDLYVTGTSSLIGNVTLSGELRGPANFIIDPAAVGDNTGAVRIKGDLYVDGTQTYINSTTIELADFNVGIATTVGTNALLDGAGIGIGSTSIRKTITWENSSSSLKSSENWKLPDNKSLLLGDSDDLQILHDGSNSYVSDYGTGRLVLVSNGAGVDIIKAPLEYTARFITDGAVELYYDNIKEFETTGYGATVFGVLQTQGLFSSGISTLSVNTSTDALRITQLGSGNALVVEDSANPDATPFVVSATGNIGLGTVTPSAILDVRGDAPWFRPNETGADATSLRLGKFSDQNEASYAFVTNDLVGYELELRSNRYIGNWAFSRNSPIGVHTAIQLYSHYETGNKISIANTTASVIKIELNEAGNTYFNNSGVVLVGTATSTGITTQRLQVNGGAYVSGNLGIGITNPSYKLDVLGNTIFRGLVDIVQNPNSVGYGTTTALPAYYIGQAMGDSDAWRIYGESPSGTNTGTMVFEVNDDADNSERFLFRTRRTSTSIGGTSLFELTQNGNIMQYVPLLIGAATSTGTSSQRLQVTGGAYVSGNLGVGTTTPTSNLHVVGHALVSGQALVTGISTFNDKVIFNSTNSIQIPVGTTAQRDSVGTAVTGQIRYNSQFSTFEGYGPGGQWGSLGGVKDVDGNTYIIPESTPGANENVLYFYTDGSEKFRIDAVGNVGVGTTTPTSRLHVNGDTLITGITTINNNLVVNGNTLFANATTNRVGIGTTLPTSTLHVVGDARISGITSVTNIEVYGSLYAGAASTTGTSGQYLYSTGTGVAWGAFPTARTTSSQVATGGQTVFNFAYNVNFIDVFLNGVKLNSTEFTANNGSTITVASPCFAGDTLEFVSYNTVSAGTTSYPGAVILDDLTDVALTAPSTGDTLVYNGTNWVNDYTVTATTATTSQTTIHTISSVNYRSVEYTIQATRGTDYHVTKMLVLHDDTTAYNTEYGTLFTNASLGTFDVDISAATIRLRVTPSSSGTTTYKIKFTAIKV